MPVKTLIVDDEDAARSRLCKLLATFGSIDIVGEARDGLEAVDLIVRAAPDLVFLDVQMPGLDGFEVLRTLPAEMRWPLVVFATAYDEYALAAFEANAVGYLLKPIDREKLERVVERAQQLTGPKNDGTEMTHLRTLAQATRRRLQHVVARLRDRYLLLALEEVYFFRVEDGLVKVKTDTHLYRTDYNLSDIEDRLPDPPFFRAHRSIIVNAAKVAEVAPLFKGSYMLVMSDKERSEIQVSERQSKLVRELLQLRPAQ
jgi:DNA-binding LytR/AlgR family response regulator